MRTLISIAALLLCTAASPVWADDAAEPQLPADGRIKKLLYDESDVYTITTKYGYQTNIVFERGEEVQTISVGDRSLWQIIPTGNRLYIRPMEDDVVTNMTVMTNRRSYQFDLKSVGEKKSGNIYVAKFVYPDDKPKAAPMPPVVELPPMPAQRETPGTTPFVPKPPVPGQPNYNYTFSGPDDLAPVQVYDDGKSTFIRYRDINQPLPNAYVIGRDGQEHQTNFMVRDQLMVVETVAPELVLKNSNGTVHVYNELLNPQ